MIEIDVLFKPHHARSKAFDEHTIGDVTFVSNGLMNNGIVGFVTPLKGDRVFNFRGICISAFCEATVQFPPFIARGNGGSGLTVLEPKREMTYEELLFHAATISEQHWKFSFGRMLNHSRLRNLRLVEYHKTVEYDFSRLIPKPSVAKVENFVELSQLKQFRIDKLFSLKRGDFHSLQALKRGKYPTVSRTTENNGIVGYYAIPQGANVYSPPAVTVSTTTGDAFVQLEEFLATDNVVILTPKEPMAVTTLYFIALMLNREKWRYSYGRQCYKEKFAKTLIALPITDSEQIDEKLIAEIVTTKTYWSLIPVALNKAMPSRQTLNKFLP